MIGPYLLEMIVEVKKAFINFLRINSDSNLPDPLNNSLSTSSHENTHINGHNYSCSVNKNSGIRIDECNKDSYRCRRSFKGLTISDSLDLATNRTQSSLYSNLPPESIELDLICADKIFSNKGSSRNGHLFCPVPLDGDTFCDHCNQPIWELGWRPVCFKCAKCHMTCHWLCKDEVAVVCDDDAKTIKHASEVVPLFPKIVPEHNEQKVESTVFELSASLENDSTDCVPCEGILVNNHLTSESDISPLDTSLNDLNEMNSPVENLIDHVPSERFAPQSISSSLGQHTFTTTDCSTQLDVSAKMDCGTPTKLKVESLLPPTLSRRATDCYKSKKSVGVKLVTRHSFLCGNKPNVCLAYDFSSLDKEAIRDRGIFVRHLSPSLNELQNTSEPLQSTNLISDISNFDTLVLSNERSISKPEVSDIGLASVIQTTQEFIRTKPKRSFQTHLLSSTTLPLIPMVVGPRSVLPWSSDRLKQLVQIFSMNEFGLQAANLTGADSCDCEGQVRVHINLLRPIQMLLTARPASIFDVVSSKSGERNDDSEDDEDEDEDVSNGIENDQCLRLTQCENDNNYSTVSHSFIPTANIPNLPSNVDRVYKAERNIIGSHHRLCRTASKVSTFRLPRGSTKVLHVRLSTTAQMVICALLDRFGIQDNPQKFALYEHTIEGDQKVSVRKLFDDESPLGLLFKWADQDPDNFNNTLGVKRLVLQENETGDIEWTTFSLSELYTFLGILNREESDYRRRIELKYEIRKKEIKRLMELHNNKLKSLDMSKHDQFDSNISNGTSVITEQCENEIVTNQSFRNSESNVYCCTDSMSAPVSPTLFRKRNEQIDSKDEKASSPRVSNSPDSCSSPEATLHPNTIKHGLLSNVVSTLPRTPTSKISEISNSNKLPSIFKTFSNFKAKKAVLAQQKRLAKIEKARVKAEQQKEQVKGHSHSPWKWRGFGTLSPSSSSSLSPHLPSHQ